jgi:hypothetical protein
MQKGEYCIFTIIYWYFIIRRSNVTLGDGMDYRLQILGGSVFVLFQYSGCGLKEIGEKPGNLSVEYCGDLQNMKCLLADCYTTC